jgi:hypothetical protein
MSGDVIAEKGDWRVRIEVDDDGYAANPRDYMATEIVGPDLRNWTVRTESAQFQREFDEIYHRLGGDVFPRYMRIFHDIEVVPVYMYEHSAVALSTGSFIGRAQHAEWDSGQVGFAYITPEKLEETGITDYAGAISTEVETLGQWMNGEVYGYVLEERVEYAAIRRDEDGTVTDVDYELTRYEWEETDSCWGIIGYDWAEKEATAAFQAELQAEKEGPNGT